MTRASFLTLTPVGLNISRLSAERGELRVVAHSAAEHVACPACGRMWGHVHSRYWRQLLDLPAHDRVVRLRVQVHRFRCVHSACARRIFGEPLAAEVAARAARRTARPERIVHHLGVALGGRPAASLARRLMLPVNKDTRRRTISTFTVRHTAFKPPSWNFGPWQPASA